MSSYLIDDRGKLWPGNSHPLLRADLPEEYAYAVFDRGFVHLRAANGAITILFNPHRVVDRGLVAAFYAICDSAPRRLMLVYGDGEERTVEIAGSVAQASGRIDKIVRAATPVARPLLTWRRRPLDRPPAAFRDRIAELLQARTEAGELWSGERQDNLASQRLLNGAAIIRNPVGTSRLLIEHWGAARNMLGPRWLQLAGGREVEDQPFPVLGARVAALYRRTFADNRPRLHAVDSAIPTADGRLVRRGYTRLVIPYGSATGDRYILALNLDENNSDA